MTRQTLWGPKINKLILSGWIRLGFVSLACGVLVGCDQRESAPTPRHSKSPPVIKENIDEQEKADAALLKPAVDPIAAEMDAFREETREAFQNRRFDDLEKTAALLREDKSLFKNGSWKLVQFYESMTCSSRSPDLTWQRTERLLKEWKETKPDSITPRVAGANHFVSYAWKARGNGYADTVTGEGNRLFEERLATALTILNEAKLLPQKDAYFWRVKMDVALGQGWPKQEYEVLVDEAHAFEPQFWGYDVARAFSLLPRWYGKSGEWKEYALKSSERPEGLGTEIYARIAIYLDRYFDNIFREGKASWPTCHEGLEKMMKKYPDSLEILSQSALLASSAQDRPLAKALFEKLGDTYLPGVWRRAESFTHCRHWARTGEW